MISAGSIDWYFTTLEDGIGWYHPLILYTGIICHYFSSILSKIKYIYRLMPMLWGRKVVIYGSICSTDGSVDHYFLQLGAIHQRRPVWGGGSTRSGRPRTEGGVVGYTPPLPDHGRPDCIIFCISEVFTCDTVQTSLYGWGGVFQTDDVGQEGGGVQNSVFARTSLMDDPLASIKTI